jgi:anti-sigma factor RsiW
MRCEECQQLVEDYFDGELDEGESSRVAQHINACPACASLYERLEREQRLYLSYECDAQPAPAFWDNVMKRAAQEENDRAIHTLSRLRAWLSDRVGGFAAPRFSPSLTALIVLVAVGITVLVMSYVRTSEKEAGPVSISQNEGAPVSVPATRPSEVVDSTNPNANDETTRKKNEASVKEPPPQLARTGRKGSSMLEARPISAERINRRTLAANRQQTPDELVREAEQKYVAAIAMLSRDVNRRRSRLDAETAARFERTLAAVDRTIADTRRAARRHPGDPVAAQYLLTAYAKKVDVLREMIGY